MDPLEIVASTAEAAYATDEHNRIVIWNRAAEQLLGYSAEDVLGRSCHNVICGRDLFGNRYCDEVCALINMVRRREGVRRFEMDIRKASGEFARASVTIMVVPGPRLSQYTVVHLLHPAARRGEVERIVTRGAGDAALTGASSSPPKPSGHPQERMPLTVRELEVLRLVVRGTSTREIADALFISIATVRNHIQHILGKLNVHSKVEAVALALQNRLI